MASPFPVRYARFFGLAISFVLGPGALCQAGDAPQRAADVPAPVPDKTWYQSFAAQQRILTNQHCPLVFIGDSLTEFWTSTGAETWAARMAPLQAADIGLAGDRTENVLWRIQRLDFHRAQPRVFVLLMGTNNLGMTPPDAPEAVVKGIDRAVGTLGRRFPAARLLVLGIPPSGFEPQSALRQRIQATNALLAKVAWPKAVTFVESYPHFVTPKDRWIPGLSLDGTHLSAAGYQVLGALLADSLKLALEGTADAAKKP